MNRSVDTDTGMMLGCDWGLQCTRVVATATEAVAVGA